MGLEITNLSLSLGGKEIVRDVTFAIANGELLSLLGPSGAGKTTMIKAVSGVLRPETGTIAIDGEIVNDVPAHRRRAPVVFQDLRLFPHLNLEDNVAFPLKMRGMRRTERLSRAREILSLVHLDGLGKRHVNQVSGGQQQRAALARALAGDPRVLLLDEPFSSLDESLREEMRELVMEIHRKLGLTTVLVTHDAMEALLLSDHIVYLHEGRMIQLGTPADLYERPATPEVAGCFGRCTVLRGVIEGRVFRDSGLTLPLPAPPGGYTTMPPGDGVAATAVIRNGGVHLASGGPLPVASCTYCGDGYLVGVSTGTDVVAAQSPIPFVLGEHLDLKIGDGSLFVFPDGSGKEGGDN